MRLRGVWYNPIKNELIEISETGGIFVNCCITSRFGSYYYLVGVRGLNSQNWVKIGNL